MNRKSKNSQSVTALYCRLSIEDGRDNESMSIQNQKVMLKDFAEKNGLLDHAFYVDDGFTGRNFNRPAFQQMIADIEAGKVKCVITKDGCVNIELNSESPQKCGFCDVSSVF